MSFYGDSGVGTFDLGSGDNTSFEFCNQCIFVVADKRYKAAKNKNDKTVKFFFQKSGTLTVDAAKLIDDYYFGGQSKGSLKDVKLVEMKVIDWKKMSFEEVDDPECIEIVDTSWNTMLEVDCVGKVCGDDGAGGSCGECTGDTHCNTDGTACEPYACKEITVNNIRDITTAEDEDNMEKVYGSSSFQIGGVENDLFQIVLIYPEEGTIDLGFEPDDILDYLPQYLLVYEDLQENGSYSKAYFQQKGSFTLEKLSTIGEDELIDKSKGSFRDIRLVEATIDSTVTPVQGGSCLTIKNGEWNTFDDTSNDDDPQAGGDEDNQENDEDLNSDTDTPEEPSDDDKADDDKADDDKADDDKTDDDKTDHDKTDDDKTDHDKTDHDKTDDNKTDDNKTDDDKKDDKNDDGKVDDKSDSSNDTIDDSDPEQGDSEEEKNSGSDSGCSLILL